MVFGELTYGIWKARQLNGKNRAGDVWMWMEPEGGGVVDVAVKKMEAFVMER